VSHINPLHEFDVADVQNGFVSYVMKNDAFEGGSSILDLDHFGEWRFVIVFFKQIAHDVDGLHDVAENWKRETYTF